MTSPGPREEHEGHGEQQQPGQRGWPRRAVRPAIAAVAAIVSLYWLSRYADLDAIVPLVQGSHRSALAGAVALLVASLVAKSLRWRALMPSGTALSRVEAYQIFHVSILLNNLLPFRAGDGVRIFSPTVRRTVPPGQAILVLLVERLLDLGLLLIITAVVLPLAGPEFVARVPRPGTAAALALAVVVILVAGVALVVLVAPRLRARGRQLWLVTRRGVLGVLAYDRSQVSRIVLWTAVAWAGTFWLHYLLLDALSVEGTLLLAVVVTLTTNFSMVVPGAPANIGVFHAAAAAPLLAVGVSADLSVAYAVLLHAVNTLPPIAIGLACLAISGARARMPALVRSRG